MDENRVWGWLKRNIAVNVGVITGVVYGLGMRLFIGWTYSEEVTFFYAFIFLVPLMTGFVTVFFTPIEARHRWASRAIIACLIAIAIGGVIGWELLICLVIASPIFVGEAMLGGMLAHYITRSRDDHQNGGTLSALVFALLLPMLTVPLEQLIPTQTEVRTVHSFIDIDAPAEVVWANITNLDPIVGDEQREAFFHLVGLPRPLEAQMECAEVGCVRRGEWEHDLAFDGTITRIRENETYWVDLQADTSNASSPYAPLEMIGGPVFAMLDDGYEIEPLPGGGVRLHLYSSYRVTTHINAYAGLWLDFLLRDIQGYILDVEKTRSEGL